MSCEARSEAPWRLWDVNPFLLDLPAVVAFSGGRTSGLMLYEILHAHREAGRPLPLVVFCNTGKERVETLDFVREVERQWSVPVVWLEYRWEPGRHFFEVVTYETASRDGRPFGDAIRARSSGETGGYLPNRVSRYCTAELKVKTMWRWAKANGLSAYTKAIGLRYDEPGRVNKVLASCDRGELLEPTLFPGETVGDAVKRLQEVRVNEKKVCPLYDARATLFHVTEFWKAQPFDLALRPHEGNCDLCFLKRRGSLLEILGRRPDLAAWWAEQEAGGQRTFRSPTDRPRYELLLAEAQQPTLFPVDDDDDIPCACTD